MQALMCLPMRFTPRSVCAQLDPAFSRPYAPSSTLAGHLLTTWNVAEPHSHAQMAISGHVASRVQIPKAPLPTLSLQTQLKLKAVYIGPVTKNPLVSTGSYPD